MMPDDSAEEWRACERVSGHYEVSNRGRVRRAIAGTGGTYAGRVLKPSWARPGYFYVCFWISKRRVKHYVHVLVAEAFLPPKPSPQHQVNHRDGNKLNNDPDNLEWVTHAENYAHARALGLVSLPPRGNPPPPVTRGEAHSNAKLTEREVKAIRRLSREFTLVEVAEVLGVDPSLVGRIRRGKAWRHVT